MCYIECDISDTNGQIAVVFITLWLMMPAYLANTIAVITGGRFPIDQGKMHSDGNRILGDGKTWSGLLGGTIGGIIVGYVQLNFGTSFMESLLNSPYRIYYFDTFWGGNPLLTFFLLSFGALLGDLTASFFKRRQNLGRGAKYPLLDMYDFIVMSLLLINIGSFVAYFMIELVGGAEYDSPYLIYLIWSGGWWNVPLFTLLIVTPILHRGVNIIGYKIGVKNEPW